MTYCYCLGIPVSEKQLSSIKVVIQVENGTVAQRNRVEVGDKAKTTATNRFLFFAICPGLSCDVPRVKFKMMVISLHSRRLMDSGHYLSLSEFVSIYVRRLWIIYWVRFFFVYLRSLCMNAGSSFQHCLVSGSRRQLSTWTGWDRSNLPSWSPERP